MAKTLAKQYGDLIDLCDAIHDFSKVFEFEEKYTVLDSTSKIGDWISVCRIFIDGSVYGWSRNSYIKLHYCTKYGE